MHPVPDHARRLESLVRTGTVFDVDHAAAKIRVRSGGILTDWIPWQAGQTAGVRQWSPPKVGEQVTMLSPSGETGAAVALCGLYSDANPPPSSSPYTVHLVYPDGAEIIYDHAAGELTASGIKTVNLTCETVNLTCDTLNIDSGEINSAGAWTHDGDITASGISQVHHTHTDPQGGNTGEPK